VGHGVNGVRGLACPEEGRDRGVVAGPQLQLGGSVCCLLGRGHRRGGLVLFCIAAFVSGSTNLFLKLSVASFDDPKALQGLRHESVIWYLARMYSGSPGSGGVGVVVACGVPLFVDSRSFLLSLPVGSCISL
jgi:hypothetical protein